MKAISSGIKAADAAIHAGACWYLGITIVTDGTKDVIATVYDDPDSSDGTEVDYVQCSDEMLNVCHMLRFPVWCANGIYVEMDAAEGDYIVWYAL